MAVCYGDATRLMNCKPTSSMRWRHQSNLLGPHPPALVRTRVCTSGREQQSRARAEKPGWSQPLQSRSLFGPEKAFTGCPSIPSFAVLAFLLHTDPCTAMHPLAHRVRARTTTKTCACKHARSCVPCEHRARASMHWMPTAACPPHRARPGWM